jgi:hypothetical protein
MYDAEKEMKQKTALMVRDNFHWLDHWWTLNMYDDEQDAIVEAYRLGQCRGENEEYPKYKVNGRLY